MACGADGRLVIAKHRIGRMNDVVILVTRQAVADPESIKDRLVRTLLKEFGLAHVTCSTHVRNRCRSRRSCAMIAVAVIAGRGREIQFLVQRLGMNAAHVFRQLVGWYFVRIHVVRIDMATTACFRHPQWVHWRTRVFHGANIVMTVAANAGRRLGIAFRDPLAVNTGLVLGFLVDAKRRIEFLHECRIAVALPTK